MPLYRTKTSPPAKPAPLDDLQRVLLSQAARREDRRLILPAHVKGSVRPQQVARLLAEGLIAETGLPGDVEGQDYIVSDAGLLTLGIAPADPAGNGPPPPSFHPRDGMTVPSTATPAPWPAPCGRCGHKPPRAGSKLARLIDLLARPEGVSMAELRAATGWLAHSTRAALTGLRKRGVAIERGTTKQGVTHYFAAQAAAPVQAADLACPSAPRPSEGTGVGPGALPADAR